MPVTRKPVAKDHPMRRMNNALSETDTWTDVEVSEQVLADLLDVQEIERRTEEESWAWKCLNHGMFGERYAGGDQ